MRKPFRTRRPGSRSGSRPVARPGARPGSEEAPSGPADRDAEASDGLASPTRGAESVGAKPGAPTAGAVAETRVALQAPGAGGAQSAGPRAHARHQDGRTLHDRRAGQAGATASLGVAGLRAQRRGRRGEVGRLAAGAASAERTPEAVEGAGGAGGLIPDHVGRRRWLADVPPHRRIEGARVGCDAQGGEHRRAVRDGSTARGTPEPRNAQSGQAIARRRARSLDVHADIAPSARVRAGVARRTIGGAAALAGAGARTPGRTETETGIAGGRARDRARATRVIVNADRSDARVLVCTVAVGAARSGTEV